MQHVGVDIVEIPRIEKVIRRWGKTFLQRVFTPSELKLYNNTSSLAARFAAKEAVLKALGACDKGISWQEIEILAEHNGKPLVNLIGRQNFKPTNLPFPGLISVFPTQKIMPWLSLLERLPKLDESFSSNSVSNLPSMVITRSATSLKGLELLSLPKSATSTFCPLFFTA